jgi:kynurenine 3-monooxygenase
MPSLLEDYFTNPTGSMVTIKCHPWHVDGRAALLGDAAHAIVPFFGQGMNCAFEDCTVLDQCLEHAPHKDRLDWAEMFRQFVEARKSNTDAIADLAVENFVEMRDYVAQPKFLLKKKVEHGLEERFPQTFIPKYSMVTFHRIPYAVARERGKIQDQLLKEICADIDRIEDVDWARAERLVETRLEPYRASDTAEAGGYADRIARK